MSFPHETECLVIGGGLAGAMAGVRLAEAGRQAILVEREAGPSHKVCGEFLSAEAVSYLRECGVDPIQHGARQVASLRFSAGGRVIEMQVPFPALALSRSVLDDQLLRKSADRGCSVVRGVSIESVWREGDGWRAAGSDGSAFHARQVFLASGKHDVRGWARPAGRHNDLIGFKMHWRLTAANTEMLASVIELVHFPGGYGGLVGVEDGAANLSVVIRRGLFQRMRSWADLLAHMRGNNPLLDERLTRAEPMWERPLAVSPIPYGYMARGGDGCWRMGDQAAVIPSFTGDGMAIALHSATLAVEMFLAGRTVGEYQSALAAQLKGGMRIAVALSQLMASRAARALTPPAMALLPLVLRPIAKATRIPSRALQMDRSRA